MTPELKRALSAYLKDRSADGYLQLRTLVTSSPHYAPYSEELQKFRELYERGQYQQAVTFLRGHLDNWVLSPRAHQMLSAAHGKLNQTEPADMERTLAWVMVEALLATGDGSESAPYQVTRLEDEYDLLEYLEKESKGQALMKLGDRECDRHECEDGTVLYFDVTVPRSALLRELSPKKPWEFWKR